MISMNFVLFISIFQFAAMTMALAPIDQVSLQKRAEARLEERSLAWKAAKFGAGLVLSGDKSENADTDKVELGKRSDSRLQERV